MANRITDTQIELARDAWRRGKSIPECCSISNMSRGSFMKYLGSELEAWTEERLQQQRINEIQPEEQTLAVATDTGETTIDSDEDFIRLIEAEFAECTNSIEAKDLYHYYKQQATTSFTRVEALRQLYEANLKSSTSMVSEVSAKQHQQTIRAFKSKHNIKCPVPRTTTLQDWSEQRLLEHMYY